MSELTEHDRRWLGLDPNWRVVRVDFQPDAKRVEIKLEHLGGTLTCPEGGAACTQADLAHERT